MALWPYDEFIIITIIIIQALWPYEFIDSDGARLPRSAQIYPDLPRSAQIDRVVVLSSGDPDNAEAGDAIPFALGASLSACGAPVGQREGWACDS